MTALPVAWPPLEAALRQRRPVRHSYHGRQRIICPHALGWNKNGRPIVLGYQTAGQTSTGALPPDPRRRWRCLFVDEVEHVALAEPPSACDTADHYNTSRPLHSIDDATIAITITPSNPPDDS